MIGEFIVLAALAGAPDVAGVVRGGADVRPARGLVRVGDRLRTGSSGWAEIHVAGRGRLRLFPRTEVQLVEGRALRVVNGRAWLQTHRPTDLVVRGGVGQVSAGTSVIIEDTQSSGLVVAVRAGAATVGSVEVTAGQVWRRPVLGAAKPPRRGGEQLADLLRQQMHDLIGDWSGLEAWLTVELERAEIGRPRGLTPGGVVRSEQEAAGAGSSGALTEAALRPPPFFEEEVPPRGPNVRIEVDFSED